MSFYTCKGKGGRYVVVGTAKAAGFLRAMRTEDVIVYRDIDDGQLYFRSASDFKDRMELVDMLSEEVETMARSIYENWSDQPGYVPWVDRGNSLKQDEARSLARSAIFERTVAKAGDV